MPDRVKLWQIGCLVLPLIGLIAPIFLVRLLGGFGPGFRFVGQELLPSEAFGTLGAMLFPMAGYQYARMRMEQAQAIESQSWPIAPGRVEMSDVAEQRGYRGGTFYVVTVRYTYRVGGVDYRGDRLGFAPRRLTSRELADELVRKYAAGATVAVRYDDVAPQDSVLETSADLSEQRRWMVVLFAGLPLLAALVVVVRAAVH